MVGRVACCAKVSMKIGICMIVGAVAEGGGWARIQDVMALSKSLMLRNCESICEKFFCVCPMWSSSIDDVSHEVLEF